MTKKKKNHFDGKTIEQQNAIIDKQNRFKWQQEIAYSLWIEFKPNEKELIMKLFEHSLDAHIKDAKKSHRIQLLCFWKNKGCYKKGKVFEKINVLKILNKK